jgi:hypothetical protein
MCSITALNPTVAMDPKDFLFLNWTRRKLSVNIPKPASELILDVSRVGLRGNINLLSYIQPELQRLEHDLEHWLVQ